MKVFIIARGYPTKKYKMDGIFEFDQAKALAQAGVEVVYIATSLRSIRKWRKWGYQSFNEDGVHVEIRDIPCVSVRLPRNILNIIEKRLLIKLYEKVIIKYGKPDIIHSHFINKGHITAEVFKNTDIPLVHTEHFSRMNQDVLSEYYKDLGERTYSYMDKVIAVSKPFADRLKEKFGVEVEVIPNIVDTSIFKYAFQDNSNSDFNFISVGGLIKGKGMDLLIYSFYNSFKDNKKVKLYIYGDGPERKALASLISKLNLTNQVFLKGLVDRRIIGKKMQECQCFVLASKSETFGVAYIEAMAAGLPVIATSCGGPEDFVNESNGILIEVDNHEELTKALLYMYKNSRQYNREVISKETIKKYSSQNIAKLIIYKYQNLLKGKTEVNKLSQKD